MGNVIVSCTSGADSAENVTVACRTIQSIGAPPVSELHERFVAAGALFDFAGDGAITFSY